ncbi:MAG: substrate-binding domain-containing protein [Anaerolineae bacterium]|jgi:ribose transport system substrate-binding protein|nr:substrate-binding domain-containing protein [Anaerolineae bacterium]
MKTFLRRTLLIAALLALVIVPVLSQDALPPLDSDTEPDRIAWSDLEEAFGPVPTFEDNIFVGAVAKTLINEYWRSLGEGYVLAGERLGADVILQAAQNEADQLGQLAIAEAMLTLGFDVLLVSPQSDANLVPAVEQAQELGIPVINVNDAVIPTAENYVGNVQRDNGVRAARWFIENFPEGGKVAVIEGQAGVYAAVQRTDGFITTITTEADNFEVVASVPGNWDRQLSFDAAATIIQQHPDIIGFYANNDGMALGVVEAVKAAGLLEQIRVIGTDGISDAYASILAGELTGTIDSFPVLTGEVALEVALRLLGGQDLPRVVSTPQALITLANYERYYGEGADTRAALIEDAMMEAEAEAGS